MKIQNFDKQLKYANRKQIPYVVILGDKEMKDKTYTLKDMAKNSQEELSLSKLISKLS